MRLIVLGASGLIGRELLAAARAKGQTALGTGASRAGDGLLRYDMRAQTLRSVVPDLGRDDVVYLLSGYGNPSWIFEHPEEARALNLTASKKVVDESLAAGARLVFMSSVEAFDGEDGDYREDSPLNPLNLYGRLKAEMEAHIKAAKGRTCIVRTGWNVGWTLEDRCVVKLTYETLLKPGARMARDNSFSLIDVRDAAEGLRRLAPDGTPPVMHLAARPPVVRTALADLVIKTSRRGREMSYTPVSFSEISYSEPRGRRNELDATLAATALGMSFRPSDEVVRAKVELLDRGGK